MKGHSDDQPRLTNLVVQRHSTSKSALYALLLPLTMLIELTAREQG